MKTYSDKISEIKKALNEADAVFIGAGAGLSTAAGYVYAGERFNKYFSDFKEKYGLDNMYYGGFYPYKTPEEKWAFWKWTAQNENATYVCINLDNADAPDEIKKRSVCINADIRKVILDLIK